MTSLLSKSGMNYKQTLAVVQITTMYKRQVKSYLNLKTCNKLKIAFHYVVSEALH